MNKDLDILKAILLEAEGDEKEVKKNDAEEKPTTELAKKPTNLTLLSIRTQWVLF